MRKISYLCMLGVMCVMSSAHADYSDKKFRREVLTGLDIVSVRETFDTVVDDAPGELGGAVYQTVGAVQDDDIRMFIPTSMYVRAGGGLNLGFATSRAEYDGDKYESSDTYTTQIGLGWNLSSYVRAEVDFQETTFGFSDLKDRQATYQTLSGMLYFDLARRYVMTGDITRRRRFVPFMGFGAGMGHYEFEGTDGASGFVISAPRAEIGFNLMLTDVIGVDVAYQYQMMIGNGFGWGASHNTVDGISNIMASLRVNF